MSTYQLVREQIIPRPLDEVFSFFADARNLETLTPPWLHFQILTPGQIEMQVGTMIQYALRVHGLPVRWTTAITVWKPPFEFVDVQLSGPYALWHHRHTFEADGRNTRMIDEVNYALPCGWLGQVMRRLLVERDLRTIFKFREQSIERVFPPSSSNADSLHGVVELEAKWNELNRNSVRV